MKMTPQQILDYCLTKKEAYLDFPFGLDSHILKVKNKIFAQIFCLKGENTITLNCTSEMGQIYRQLFSFVVRGYHCPPVQQPYFNSMPIDKIDDKILLEMIDHSYETVVKKLPKYKQAELLKK